MLKFIDLLENAKFVRQEALECIDEELKEDPYFLQLVAQFDRLMETLESSTVLEIQLPLLLRSVLVEVVEGRQKNDELNQNREPIQWRTMLGVICGRMDEAVLGTITDPYYLNYYEQEYRADLIRLAAMAIAAVESMDVVGKSPKKGDDYIHKSPIKTRCPKIIEP